MMAGHPVDKGWAWMICLGVGVHAYFVIGGLKSMGILFVELIEHFEGDSRLTALTIGVMAAGYAIVVMFATPFCKRFGCRSVALCGGVLCGLSPILTMFAPNIIYVIISLGLLTGVAYGSMQTPTIVILNTYFDKRKSLANGLAMCGASVGQLSLPYLTAFMLEEYNFQGALLIYGAIAFNTVPAALLMRPPGFYSRGADRPEGEEALQQEEKEGGVEGEEDHVHMLGGKPEVQRSQLSLHSKESRLALHGSRRSLQASQGSLRAPPHRPHHLTSTGSLVLGLSLESLASVGNFPETNAVRDRKHAHHPPTASPLAARENGGGGQLAQPDLRISPPTPDIQDPPASRRGAQARAVANFCNQTFDRELMKCGTFWAYWFGLGIGHAGFIDACLFLPSLAVELFGDKYVAALLLAIMGIIDIVGRIGGGAFADLNLVRRSHLIAVAMGLVGLTNVLAMLRPTFPVLVVWALVMGLLGGLYRILMPVVIRDLFGLHKLASAVGMTYCALGLIALPVPTLIETLAKATGSYVPAMQFCGALLLVGAVLLGLLSVCQRLDVRRATKRGETSCVLEVGLDTVACCRRQPPKVTEDGPEAITNHVVDSP